ncbi:MAG: NADH-quinone oxidoreductase subunit NuoG, partial [Pseudohongiellaceae bacterium]
MAKITVDGETYEVNPENNLLQECLSLGMDLPYFCWHPCMGSVGACRQCAVKQYRNAEDRTGMLVMACMTPAADGSIISIGDAQAREFRANVIESLMISHPHDCPVCEEGGECHLQDMTLMSGHNYRRYDKQKVTHNNQYLGPFIGHEMNRCITCYRCVRFYNDYAGGTDLSAQACHHHVYFGRQTDGCLESEFSGNLVEVCPTGVFTDATFSEHYSRKWDLQTAPSICTGCAAGCNTTPGERYGSLRRIVNRYHPGLNGYFLCDRGRFGYDFVNCDARLHGSVSRIGGTVKNLDSDEAHKLLHGLVGARTIGIGSPRAGNEANFALRQLVGSENFYAGMDDTELAIVELALAMARNPAVNTPDIRDMEAADFVLIVGEDVTNTAPRIALALRQTVHNRAVELARAARIPIWQDAAVRELAQHEKTPLYILSGYGTRLDDIAAGCLIDAVPGLLAAAVAIAHGLDNQAPTATEKPGIETAGMVEQIIASLRKAKNPLIITGSGAGSSNLANAAVNIALACAVRNKSATKINFCCLAPEVNSMGLGMLVEEGRRDLDAAFEKMS